MIPEVEKNLTEAQEAYDTWDTVYQWFYWSKVILPKTSETIGLLERMLRQHTGMDIDGDEPDENIRMFGPARISRREFEQRLQDEMDSRSVTWIIGTSLIFEAVILGFACWRFSRRDF